MAGHRELRLVLEEPSNNSAASRPHLATRASMRSWTSFRVDSESFAEVLAGNCIGMYRDCGVSVPSRRLVAFNTESPP